LFYRLFFKTHSVAFDLKPFDTESQAIISSCNHVCHTSVIITHCTPVRFITLFVNKIDYFLIR